MSDLLTRIQEVISWSALGPTAFADEIGVARPVISHILSARNKASLEVVQRILGRFPEISPIWLLSGEGEMVGAGVVSGPSKLISYKEQSVANLRNGSSNSFDEAKGREAKKENMGSALTESKAVEAKKLVKVMWFYSDGSFESYDPS